MRRISYSSLTLALLVIGLSLSSIASAQPPACNTCPGNTPNPNGAVLALRVFNDCPTSSLNTINNYPALILFDDQDLDCSGYANLHAWSFSADGGHTAAAFENCSHYRFAATVVLDGSAEGEGGLRVSPWWSPNADGKFMLNTVARPTDPAHDREISCFGGRLPFYSFTINYGLHYVKGTAARLDITYNPHTLVATDPATIIYRLTYGGNNYSSGPLPFDEGTAAEGHGTWGELCPAWVGGYAQPYLSPGFHVGLAISFFDIFFEGPSATAAVPTTWGKLKSLYR